jgi:hypothetical protein
MRADPWVRAVGTVTAPGRAFSRSADPAVDEQALIRRYTRDGWTVAECGRRFSISAKRARAILVRNGVEPQAPGPAAPLDEDAVVRAYRKHRSLRYVAKVMRTREEKVRAILDQRGQPHGVHTPPPEIDSSGRATLVWSRPGPPTEPSPADLLWPFQAARMLNVDVDFLTAAAKAGQIPEAHSATGQRRYARRDVADLGRRLGLSPMNEEPR